MSLNIMMAAIIAVLAIAVNPSNSYAREECFTQYGGGETCVDVDEDADLVVDKTIWNPKADEFQNHIKPNDGSHPYKFESGEEIVFRIKVKNTGDVRIEDIKLEDILPYYLRYEDGDGDDHDDGRKVKFDEFDLNEGDSREFTFTAEVVDEGILPNDDYLCLTNIAKAKGYVDGDDDEKEESIDYANFCIDLPGGKVKGKESPSQLPTTGPIVFFGTMALGLTLVGFGFKELAKTK